MYSEYNNEPECNLKISVKWLELPVQKFNSAVPHFVDSLKVCHNNIAKLKRLNQWDDVQKQYISATTTVKQLTSMVSEMDKLRNQVEDCDIEKFDKQICDSRQRALNAIQSHNELSIQNRSVSDTYMSQDVHREDVNDNKVDQLQIMAGVTEDIRQLEQQALELEGLQEKIVDIHTIYQDLAQLVHDQGESVDKIENTVETVRDNVVEGERMLSQAVKYKSGVYPLVGALVGSVLGGPVGLFAGFKLGGLTAFGCGLLGFTGGKILKNHNEVTVAAADHHRAQL